jgi:hypothetical protein
MKGGARSAGCEIGLVEVSPVGSPKTFLWSVSTGDLRAF